MPRLLTADAIGRYRREGYCAPVRAVAPGKAAAMREQLEAAGAGNPGRPPPASRATCCPGGLPT